MTAATGCCVIRDGRGDTRHAAREPSCGGQPQVITRPADGRKTVIGRYEDAGGAG